MGYFIVDSTEEADAQFGEAFVLFLPYTVKYGYTNTRNGIINLKQDGLYLSIRTFVEPYANYIGAYQDNSFYLEKVGIPEEIEAPVANIAPGSIPDIVIPEPTIIRGSYSNSTEDLLSLSASDKYAPQTVKSFRNIAKTSK